MAKSPKNIPTEVGQRVSLRGRPLATGEITAVYTAEDPAWIQLVDRHYPLYPSVNVAWDWESYKVEPPIKGMAWGYCHPDELEVINA